MDPRELQWSHYTDFMQNSVDAVLDFLVSLKYDSPEHQELVEKAALKYNKYETLAVSEAKAIWELYQTINNH